jgi:hypothetical protein
MKMGDRMPRRTQRLTTRISGALRRLERAIGADLPGRSLWVWLIPLGTTAGTFAMCMWLGLVGQLGIAGSLVLAIILSAVMGSLSAVNLTSAASDARDSDADSSSAVHVNKR